MNRHNPIENTVIVIFLGLFLILYIISNYKKNKKTFIKEKIPVIQPSYGDEFYNYRGISNDNITTRIIEVSGENVIEGFSLEKVRETHSKCPVLNGAKTRVTSCIHYPNRYMEGIGKVDKGFLVSTYTKNEIDTIQRSLKMNDKNYDIIYKNGEYILINNSKNEKQVLMECNPPNYQTITSLVGTFS